ncbi:MAG: hypothetical protein ACFFCW_14305 [Candidatus Hodarchaeota archaeon]
MIRFTTHELGLSELRICRDMTGKFFVQELVEKGGFWSFTGHTEFKWISLGTLHSNVKYYDTIEQAATDVEKLLDHQLQRKCQDENLYDVCARCLYVDLDDVPVVELRRRRLDSERTNN